MSTQPHKTPLRFSGSPSNLTAATNLPSTDAAQASIVVAGKRFPLRITTNDDLIDSLAFSMPDSTLPCVQEAEVFIGDFKCSATATIKLRSKVSIEPSAITLKAPVGDSVTATLSVTNRGNSTLTLDSDHSVTLRENGELGRNIANALKQRDHDIADRLITLGNLMNSSERHELTIATSMSPTRLAVDKSSKLIVELGIPKDIGVDTTWTGSFSVLGTRLRVSVEPTASSR